MNSNIKVYLIAGVLTLILGIGFIVYIVFGSDKSSKIEVTTANSSKFVTDNFLSGKKVVENTVFVESNEKYSILYNLKLKDFTIELYGYTRNELVEIRKTAENKFKEIMKTPDEETCKLPVGLIVPASYNSQYSVINYGLSFCPNSVEFEAELPPQPYTEPVEDSEPGTNEILR